MEANLRINPPADPLLRSRLDEKLQEYKGRIAGKGKKWESDPPEVAHKLYRSFRDACYKADILEAVLSSQSVLDTHKLSLEMQVKYGEDFMIEQFCSACQIIAYYCGDTVGKKLSHGTGLSQPQQISV